MAWRFKASKYKNAAPIVPKPEACIRDVCVGSYQTYGNNIAASAAFMAFNWEHVGSSLAILSIDDCGRKSKTMPLLHAHTDTVTDIMFSPFHDGILATASQDCLVKIWHIPEKGLEQSLGNPECTFSHKQRRVETVGFHPTADCLLYSTAAGCITLYDIAAQKECFSNNEHPEVIQSLSWKQDGTVFATSCKDKIVRIIDPRTVNHQNIELSTDSHQSIKDSRVVWLGDQQRILTTGFDSARVRQVIIRDLRNFSVPQKLLELDCSTGILMPLFDPDTNMLFLAGKGDTTINYMEVTDKDPHLIEGLRHTGEQTKGACLVPKRALKVMEGEVNRVLQLTSNMVIPIMYQVPRKTYRDFHSDLYPDTNGCKTDLTASQWMSGSNLPLSKISLDPSKREHGDAPIIIHRGNLSELIKNIENKKLQIQQKAQQNGQHLTGPVTNPGFFKTTTNNTRNSNKIERVVGLNESKLKKNETVLLDGIDVNHQQYAQKNLDDDDDVDDHCEKPLSKFDLIKRFDNKYKTDSEKDITTQGFIKIKSNKSNNDEDTTATIHPSIGDVIQISGESNENDSSNDSNDCNSWTSPQSITPPKPLPRTSRNNSITDIQLTATIQPIAIDDDLNTGLGQQSFVQQQQQQQQQIAAPRPVARPRTTATSYKPRLGPKPFSSNTGDVSFDKVFSVPQAPGSGSDLDNTAIPTIVQPQNPQDTNGVEHELKKPFPPPDLIEIQIKKEEKDNIENNKNGHQEQKSLTTSERRKYEDEDEKEKLFETNNSESSGNSTESEDKPDDLKRLSSNRSSIAERRRLYENRSKSMQEEKPQSPVPLLRRDTVAKTETDGNSIRHSMPPPAATDNNEKLNKSVSGKNLNPTPVATDANKENSTTFTKRTSTVFGKVSKFRHLKGTPGHKSTQIENLRNLSRQIPGECNGFHANHERVAVPLSGPGGKIAIFELNKPGRLPDGVIPSLVNGSNIMDFQWDPFDAMRLAVACDDGVVRFWIIPNDGLIEPTNKPEAELIAHSDKIYFIRFHPLAEDVLLTASYDMTIKLWNLKTMTEQLCLKGHSDQIFDFQFSSCGIYGATVCKDTKLRIFNPRKSENPIREGNGPVGTRGARLAWAIDGQYIVVTGFDKVSERQISIYNVQNLSAPLGTVSLDVSPSILMPFYDEDSSTLFVTGKGDSTIYCYEITDEEPYICPLSHHRCSSLLQGLSFLTKNHCDVASVEFSKAYRLTNNTIEPLSFTVPRIKSELFQDDLFPPTRVLWKPTMSAEDWFTLNDKRAKKISLQPEGMECLSSIQPIVSNKKTELQQSLNPSQLISQSDFLKLQQQKIQKSVSARMEYNTTLEQDTMEGVDENDWDE